MSRMMSVVYYNLLAHKLKKRCYRFFGLGCDLVCTMNNTDPLPTKSRKATTCRIRLGILVIARASGINRVVHDMLLS